MREEEYFLVKSSLLPEIFVKVMDVKLLISSGAAGSVNEAVKRVGISRSAYYKYRDAIRPYHDLSRNKVVTLALLVENTRGLLAAVIRCLAKASCNILTINQNVPINGMADLSITVELPAENIAPEDLLLEIDHIHGVRFSQLLGRPNDI